MIKWIFIINISLWTMFVRATEEEVGMAEPYLISDLGECPIKYVMDMLYTQDGILWVVGEGNAIAKYSFETKKWETIALRSQYKQPASSYAIAQDKQGRVWIGTDRYGVFVWNGRQWKNYDKGEALLGERVFDIAVSPKSGIVAIATSAGLTLYDPNNEQWMDRTRQDGLAEDQIQTLCFDQQDHLWVGYQCCGVGYASADSSYSDWKSKRAPDSLVSGNKQRITDELKGQGLPSNVCNVILTDFTQPDRPILLGTDTGLAYWLGKKRTWEYVRGRTATLKNALMALPSDTKEQQEKIDKNTVVPVLCSPQVMPDDYVTCLMKEGEDKLWVGFRRDGVALLDARTLNVLREWKSNKTIVLPPVDRDVYVRRPLSREELPTENRVTSLVQLPDGRVYAGTYGAGLQRLREKAAGREITTEQLSDELKHPELPTPPSVEQITAIREDKLRHAGAAAVFYMGEDWSTRGDWLGSYGNVYVVNCAGNIVSGGDTHIGNCSLDYWGEYHVYPLMSKVLYPRIYPDSGSTMRYELRDPVPFYDHCTGMRSHSHWSTRSDKYPLYYDGPDLWLAVYVPDNLHEISLFFYDPRSLYNSSNDYPDHTIELRRIETKIDFSKLEGDALHDQLTTIVHDASSKMPLCQTRVRFHNTGGVYKNFFISESGCYLFRIAKNYSTRTSVNAVLFQKLGRSEKEPIGRVDNLDMTWRGVFDCGPDVMTLPPLLRSLDFLINRDADSPKGYSLLQQLLVYYSRLQLPEAERRASDYLLHVWDNERRKLFVSSVRKSWDLSQKDLYMYRNAKLFPFAPGVTSAFDNDEFDAMRYLGVDWKKWRSLQDTDERLIAFKRDLASLLPLLKSWRTRWFEVEYRTDLSDAEKETLQNAVFKTIRDENKIFIEQYEGTK